MGPSRNRRGWRPALLGLAAVALGAGCRPENVSITEPTSHAIVLAPEVAVSISLWPPLAAGELLSATLTSGIDGPAGPTARDVSGDLIVAPDGASATITVESLGPGRNHLRVERSGGETLPGGTTRVLDRGGFHGPAGGPYGAGVTYETVTRIARGEPRTIDVAVWYPTPDPEAPIVTPLEQALLAAYDAPPVAGGSLPTLVYSHGNCGWEGASSFLLADLARAGWLVAAPEHAGNTNEDPDCAAALLQEMDLRIGDVVATVDLLAGADAEPWAGLVDMERLGLAGYSAGGFSTIPLADEDPRVKALLALASPGLAPERFPLPVPVMIQTGELDETAPPDFVKSFFYDLLDPTKFLVNVLDAGHGSFATACPGDCAPGATPIEALHARIQRHARGFLGRYVAGDVRWASLIVPSEGVELLAEP